MDFLIGNHCKKYVFWISQNYIFSELYSGCILFESLSQMHPGGTAVNSDKVRQTCKFSSHYHYWDHFLWSLITRHMKEFHFIWMHILSLELNTCKCSVYHAFMTHGKQVKVVCHHMAMLSSCASVADLGFFRDFSDVTKQNCMSKASQYSQGSICPFFLILFLQMFQLTLGTLQNTFLPAAEVKKIQYFMNIAQVFTISDLTFRNILFHTASFS